MLNKNGNTEDLKEFHSNGEASYYFATLSKGYSIEYTYDKNGNELTYKNSKGHSFEYTYDKNGNELTYKDSNGYSYEYTRDKNGKGLTFKDSEGVKKGFETPVEETKETKEVSESGIPAHYDNGNGSLYLIAEQRGWNPYLFDIVKRLERSGKKGEFESDLNKSKVVIDIWLKESKLNK